jgi:hypothetical protein
MICENCRAAGKLLQELRENAAWLDEFDEVGYLHMECPGGTWCDCQHKETGVNWVQIGLDNDAK